MSRPASCMLVTRRLKPSASLVLTLLALALPALGLADVTIQQKTVTSGMGGFGDGTSEQTQVIALDKSRSDETFTYTGRMKTMAGGPRRSTTITRIDRELMWRVDDDKKQYTETTFAEMKGAMAQGAEAAEEHGHGHSHEIDMTFTAEVQRTGKKQTVNGFAAEQVIVTLTGKPKEPKPGADATTKFTLEQWLSTAVPGADEVRAHYQLMAEKLGMDPGLQRLAGSAMGSYSGPMRELGAKLKDLKGYPVRMILTIESKPNLTPEQEAQMKQAQAQAAGAQAKSADAQAEAAAEAAKAQEAQDAEAKQAAAATAAKGDVGGALGGFLGKKLGKSAKKKTDEQAAAASAGATGMPMGMGGTMAYTATTDVVSVKTGPSATSFEVPAGYTKNTHAPRMPGAMGH